MTRVGWKHWRAVQRPSGATRLEQRTEKCVLLVYPRNWANAKGPASWITSCSDEPHAVDTARGPLYDHPGYREKRGHAETLSVAKAAAKRAAAALEKPERKRRADADEIEAIAKDAEKSARGLRKFDPEKADKLRADARRLRAQMFEGVKMKRRRR